MPVSLCNQKPRPASLALSLNSIYGDPGDGILSGFSGLLTEIKSTAPVQSHHGKQHDESVVVKILLRLNLFFFMLFPFLSEENSGFFSPSSKLSGTRTLSRALLRVSRV